MPHTYRSLFLSYFSDRVLQQHDIPTKAINVLKLTLRSVSKIKREEYTILNSVVL